MGRTVLLRHDLPDGSWHYDWLISPPLPPTTPPSLEPRGLICFRVRDRIDSAEVRQFRAERLADHRAMYLDYAGPVSGGRGTVTRLAEGKMKVEVEGEGELVVTGELGEAQGRWTGTANAGTWTFARTG